MGLRVASGGMDSGRRGTPNRPNPLCRARQNLTAWHGSARVRVIGSAHVGHFSLPSSSPPCRPDELRSRAAVLNFTYPAIAIGTGKRFSDADAFP